MGVVRRAKYRVWQFWHTLRPSALGTAEKAEIGSLLNPGEMDLFCQQKAADKQHSLRVMQTIKVVGPENDDLLRAALLHDVGKTCEDLTWRDRVLVVIAEFLIPSYSERWSCGSGMGWSRPFVIKAKHPEWGADAAFAAGSSPLTVELIRWHQRKDRDSAQNSAEVGQKVSEREFNRLLFLLQQADEIS